MLVVDISESKEVKEAIEKRLGKDGYKIEQLGCYDCSKLKFPIKGIGCLYTEELEHFGEYELDKNLCKDCKFRKYIRFADFTNDTYSFFYERKSVYDFISSRKERLYNQLNKIDTFIDKNKGLILEGMADFVPIYDTYWKNVDKELLQKLSPIQQVIFLANKPEWTWSFIRELKMRNMEFVQTWNLNETIEFLIQCDNGYDKTPKFRLIPKRYADIPIERNILALFDGIGKVRSEQILAENKDISKIIKLLVKKIEGLGYGRK